MKTRKLGFIVTPCTIACPAQIQPIMCSNQAAKILRIFLKLENKISEQIKILGEEIVLKRRRSTSKISESLQVIFLISLIVTKETLI